MSFEKILVILLSWSGVMALFTGMIIHIWSHGAYIGALAMIICMVALIIIMAYILHEES